MRLRLLTAIFFLLLAWQASGQDVTGAGKPLYPDIRSWFDLAVDKTQLEVLSTLDQPKDQPWQFAVPVPVSLSPSNAGITVKNRNETVWVMAVTSKGALSLNFILSPFNLPEGAYLFVYDEAKTVILGPYTAESGNSSGIMPLLPVPGDKIILECHYPGGAIPPGTIGISQVAHDFAGFYANLETKDLYYGRSGSCEVDLNCSTNETYLQSGRAVVRLLVAGSELCSGVMVNNTGINYKAYLLTANHCIENATKAASTIFVFNYQSPWCDGPDITNLHSASGSLLRATNPDIDFSLVELSHFPSLVYKPFFSGWDITTTTPSTTFAIHHPEGDVKKISIDSNSPTTASYPAGGYVTNGFWRVLRWDMGTTEHGSSGCPLFDQNGRLRGTLTGGAATCDIPENDYFAKLSRMFSLTTISSTTPRPWLDPTGSGATIVAGRDPYFYNLSRSDTLTNILPTDPGQADSYGNPYFGYSTGHNSDSLVSYAEYFPYPGNGELAWLRLKIAKSSYLAANDSVRVYLWNGGTQPGSVIASRLIKIRETKDNFELEVDFGSTVQLTGPFYAGYKIYYNGPLSVTQSQFAVTHSESYSLPSMNTAWFNDGSSWKPFTQHPSFPMAVSLGISAIMVENSVLNSIPGPPFNDTSLTVFPNPFTTSLSFSITDTSSSSTSLTIFDNSGRVVSSTEYRNVFPGVVVLELPFLKPGIYHYSLLNDYHRFSGTVVKVRAK